MPWNTILWMIIFLVSLIVLIKASNFFIRAAEKIGAKLGISSFIIGVTLLAIGTSLPELISSVFGVLLDSSEIVVGNVTGSNITNIFLVLGCTALFSKKNKLSYNLDIVDLPLMLASAFAFVIIIWDGKFTIFEALLSIAGLLIFIIHTIKAHEIDLVVHTDFDKNIKKERIESSNFKLWGMLILSAVLLYFGAKYTVLSIIHLSQKLSIGKEIISASAVALGTSLPELIVSVTAAKKGKPEMAVGNILGSNIFNTFAVMAIPRFFGSLIIPSIILKEVVPIMVIATLIFYIITQKKKFTKWEGWMLLLMYLLFLSRLF